jgi:hypothetical protein
MSNTQIITQTALCERTRREYIDITSDVKSTQVNTISVYFTSYIPHQRFAIMAGMLQYASRSD